MPPPLLCFIVAYRLIYMFIFEHSFLSDNLCYCLDTATSSRATGVTYQHSNVQARFLIQSLPLGMLPSPASCFCRHWYILIGSISTLSELILANFRQYLFLALIWICCSNYSIAKGLHKAFTTSLIICFAYYLRTYLHLALTCYLLKFKFEINPLQTLTECVVVIPLHAMLVKCKV